MMNVLLKGPMKGKLFSVLFPAVLGCMLYAKCVFKKIYFETSCRFTPSKMLGKIFGSVKFQVASLLVSNHLMESSSFHLIIKKIEFIVIFRVALIFILFIYYC